MKTLRKITLFVALMALLVSCTALKQNSASDSDDKIDPVCGMKVAKSNAYHYKYDGKKYYFDSYGCKEAFIMNPKKFIDK